jgi:hypothetical protein
MTINEVEISALRVMAETGLTAAELARLPMDEYARLTNRPTPTQAALAALDAQYERQEAQQAPRSPQAPQSAPEAPQEQPPGIDLASMDMRAYAAFRQQYGIGTSPGNRGILDGGNSRSQAYTDAVRAQSGRTAMSTQNVRPSARLEGRTVLKPDVPATGRVGYYRGA